jgi:hypothetical protein
MADNVGIVTGSNAKIATDQHTTGEEEHYQLVKIVAGARDGNIFTVLRTPEVFKTVTATASGDTSLWTPETGKKFRLMRYMIQVTADAASTLATDFTIVLRDATTATPFAFSVFVPSVSGTGFGNTAGTGWVDLGNGILSAAANNKLNLNLSAALTAGTVRAVVAGCEE